MPESVVGRLSVGQISNHCEPKRIRALKLDNSQFYRNGISKTKGKNEANGKGKNSISEKKGEKEGEKKREKRGKGRKREIKETYVFMVRQNTQRYIL